MKINGLIKLTKEDMKLISGGVKRQFTIHFSENLASQDREYSISALIESIKSGFELIDVSNRFCDENLRKLAIHILNSKSKTYKYYCFDHTKGSDCNVDIYIDDDTSPLCVLPFH